MLEKLIGTALIEYMNAVENSFFTDPRSFWDFWKEDEGDKTIFDSMTLDGALIKDDNFATHFSSYFSKIFDSSSLSSPNPGRVDLPYDMVNSCLFFHEISENETAEAID